MKKTAISLLSVLMALCMLLSVGALASGEPSGPPSGEASEEPDILSAIAGPDGTTYANLFDVILADEYYPIWYDYCATIVGAENADDMAAGLQASISSDIYGEEAIEAFADPDAGLAFDCYFINGVESFTFRDDTITVNKTDGTSETHTYEYVGVYEIGEGESMVYFGEEYELGFPCDVYKSTDEAGEFNYFFLCGDTMEETYHIEFRYGRDLEELQGYLVGPYAYWLAAGIDEDADEKTIENVIALFCLENMDYSARTEESLAQLTALDFIGTWKADLSEYGDLFDGIDLYFVLDENGHGETTMNGMLTADFEAYAYDNGEKGDGRGIYAAFSNLEFEAESAPYTLTTNDDGDTVLTLYAEDGTISYVRAG